MRLLLTTTVKTSGTTFTTGPATSYARIRLQGAGGGGGGAGTAVGSSAGAGGGSSGGYLEKWLALSPNTAYTYAIGAAGAAGAAGANNGGAGGDTTFSDGVTTYTAKGGNGGIGGAASATIVSTLGGAAPAVSTNGDVNGSGQPGDPGFVLTAALAVSGKGGSCLFGAGGNARLTQGDGSAGVGNGYGGGGGCCLNNGGTQAGAAGGGGVAAIDEYT